MTPRNGRRSTTLISRRDSPYAPKRRYGRGDQQRRTIDSEQKELSSHYAHKETRVPTANPDSINTAREPPAPVHEGRAGEHPLAHNEISDGDLKRLEDSLRWLQRQEAATRLPRAIPLAPVPGLAPIDARGFRQSGSDDELRVPLSLEPERLVSQPVPAHRPNLSASLSIVGASIIAAPIVYYFWGGRWDLPPGPAPGPPIASFDEQSISSPSISKSQPSGGPVKPQDDDHETSVIGEISSQETASRATSNPEGATLTMLPPSAADAEPPRERQAVRALDPDQLKLLIKQGEQFALAGDLVAARTLFKRAAEAGDAAAALALGATYDPIVLAKLGVVGMGADVEQARSWYRRAESQGLAEATQRLHALANR